MFDVHYSTKDLQKSTFTARGVAGLESPGVQTLQPGQMRPVRFMQIRQEMC